MTRTRLLALAALTVALFAGCGSDGATRTRKQRSAAAQGATVSRSADDKNVYTVVDFKETLAAPLDRIETAATKLGCTHLNRIENDNTRFESENATSAG